MKLCNRCNKEISDDAFSINDNYYCDICRDLPMIVNHKIGLFPCKHCNKMMENPHTAQKYHKECTEEGQRLSMLKQLKINYKEQKEFWNSLSDEKQLELINDEGLRVLHDETINAKRKIPLLGNQTRNSYDNWRGKIGSRIKTIKTKLNNQQEHL